VLQFFLDLRLQHRTERVFVGTVKQFVGNRPGNTPS
jgi:hypothetical protein